MSTNSPVESDSDIPISSKESYSLLNFILIIIIGPVTNYFLVVLVTNGIEWISSELWRLAVEWPDLIYVGAILGGLGGGFITLGELLLDRKNIRPITAPNLISSDLAYIMMIIGITYLLEVLVEMVFIQMLLFCLEIVFFLVFGRNLAKYTLNPPKDDRKEDIVNPNQESETHETFSVEE